MFKAAVCEIYLKGCTDASAEHLSQCQPTCAHLQITGHSLKPLADVYLMCHINCTPTLIISAISLKGSNSTEQKGEINNQKET